MLESAKRLSSGTRDVAVGQDRRAFTRYVSEEVASLYISSTETGSKQRLITDIGYDLWSLLRPDCLADTTAVSCTVELLSVAVGASEVGLEVVVGESVVVGAIVVGDDVVGEVVVVGASVVGLEVVVGASVVGLEVVVGASVMGLEVVVGASVMGLEVGEVSVAAEVTGKPTVVVCCLLLSAWIRTVSSAWVTLCCGEDTTT